MTDRRVFALTAALFFAVLAWALVTYGGNGVKVAAILSLMFGGMGQFLAQDDSYHIRWTAIILNWFAILAMLVAVWSFVFG